MFKASITVFLRYGCRKFSDVSNMLHPYSIKTKIWWV